MSRTAKQIIHIITRRWLKSCLLFLLLACHHPGHHASAPAANATALQTALVADLQPAIDSLRTGDVVTRTGNDFTSDCLRRLCQTDQTYSHCGIASLEHDTLFVYHALGGEFNPDQKLLREPFGIFVAQEANKGYGIFRFEMDEKKKEKLMNEVGSAYRRGITFDMAFDLATDEKMYCSEFVGKMFRRAFGSDTLFAVSSIGQFKFLAPDNIFLSRLCHPVYHAVYCQ
jgi:Permuted papain-like amidase enzyme, YaeF/YiiX, C92 family